MPADPKLVALARAADEGEPCPQLRLVSGPTMILGTPVKSDRFAEAADEAVEQEVWAHVQQKYRRKDAPGVYHEVVNGLRPTLDRADETPEPPEPVAFTMVGALVWGFGEASGQRVPVLRVSLESISAWWLGAGTEVKGSGGGGWFYGMSIPIGN
jgi:hypothetical protein